MPRVPASQNYCIVVVDLGGGLRCVLEGMELIRIRNGCMLITLIAWTMIVHAQAPRVPYVPTPNDVVAKMLEMVRITPNDYLIDLGSGDGRIIVTAARKHGARGFGVDINPERVAEAEANAQKAGVTDKVAFYQRDLFQTDLAQATVISMYLLPRVNLELRPKLLALKPGTRLVSHDFNMDDWKPDAHVQMESPEKYGNSGGQSDIYFWVVPAQVAGNWGWVMQRGAKPVSYAAVLKQSFQMFSGVVSVNGRSVPVQNARLSGEDISFTFTVDLGAGPVRHEFRGKAAGHEWHGVLTLASGSARGRFEILATRDGGGIRENKP